MGLVMLGSFSSTAIDDMVAVSIVFAFTAFSNLPCVIKLLCTYFKPNIVML